MKRPNPKKAKWERRPRSTRYIPGGINPKTGGSARFIPAMSPERFAREVQKAQLRRKGWFI